MPYINTETFEEIKDILGLQQSIAETLSKNCYGYAGPKGWEGIKPAFDVKALVNIGQKLPLYDYDAKVASLIKAYNKLLPQVHLRHSKSMSDLKPVTFPENELDTYQEYIQRR